MIFDFMRRLVEYFVGVKQADATPTCHQTKFTVSLPTEVENNRDEIAVKEDKADEKPPTKSKYWSAPPDFVSKGERECRRVAEKVTGKLFPRTRPDFLRNPDSGHNLEIDCYCEELKLGIEYNGEQHYNFPNVFDKFEYQFDNRQHTDKAKIRMCEENNVKLIVVPYTVKLINIENYLKERL